LTAVTGAAPATAGGVDITAPEVGSCHDLTFDEYYHGKVEPEPAVDCATRHTSVTVRVRELDFTPEGDKEWGEVIYSDYVPCLKDLVRATGGRAAMVDLSAYTLTFYRPTNAQEDAGARWLRCDAVLRGGPESLAPVPQDIVIEGALPPMDVRKCRLGRQDDFALTVCTRRHKYLSTVAIRMRGDNFPGERAAKRFALRKCEDRLGARTTFAYDWVPNKFYWRAGLRHAVCSPVD